MRSDVGDSPPARGAVGRGLLQYKAAVGKNLLQKRRNLRVSICELISPLGLFFVLAVGFNLSDILVFNARTYSEIDFRLPGPVATTTEDSLDSSSSFSTGDLWAIRDLFNDLLTGPIVVPTFDQYVGFSNLVSTQIDDKLYNQLLGQTSFGRSFGNIFTLGTLHFAPAGPEVDALISYMENNTATFSGLKRRVHKNEDRAVEWIDRNANRERTWGLIVLDKLEPGDVEYKLRMNYTTTPNTFFLVNWVSLGLDDRYQRYYLAGFHTLAAEIDAFAFDYTTDSDSRDDKCEPPSFMALPFPTPDYSQNIFYTAVGYLLALVMTMSTLYPMARLVKDLVEEKETMMRETMAAMGMSLTINNLAWFTTALGTFFIVTCCITYVAATSFCPKTDRALLFTYFFLLCISEIGMAFLVSAFFSRAKLAAIIGPVILFASCLPRYIFFGTNRYEAVPEKFAASLLSTTAFSFGADVIADYEYAGIGANWVNWHEGDYSLYTSMSFMLWDTAIYLVLGAYLQKVLPTQYGSPAHPLYFLQRKDSTFIWQPRRADAAASASGGGAAGVVREDGRVSECEAVDGHEVNTVQITNLKKQWVKRGRPAVDGLNLDLFEGQITCLLGHNGAGKSTTVSVLTGLTHPTDGDCTVYGKSILHDLQGVRQDLGVCPQKNVIFPTLTVAEHLHFFAAVRGLAGAAATKAAVKLMKEVGLFDKKNARAMALSGGMKRKLCLAMALMGSPRFVLLDEPTSGMDPFSRRATWDMLRKARAGRVIVLTTHFMDEADILADRIAIMTRGRLRCCGSSLWLKSRFGVGYNLTLCLGSSSGGSPNEPSNAHTNGPSDGDDGAEASALVPAEAGGGSGGGEQENEKDESVSLVQVEESDERAAAIRALVIGEVPAAEQVSHAARETAFRIPRAAAPVFPRLLAKIQESKAKLGITAFGVSVTTLEEVFIRIADEEVSLEAHRRQQELVDDEGLLHDEDEADERDADCWSLLGPSHGPKASAPQHGSRTRHKPSMFQRALAMARPARRGRASSAAHTNERVNPAGGEEANGRGVPTAPADVELVAIADPSRSPHEGGPTTCVVPVASVDTNAHNAPTGPGGHGHGHGHGHGDQRVKSPIFGSSDSTISDSTSYADLSLFRQTAVLIRKRVIVFSRDRKGAFFQLLVPVILIGLVLGILMIEVRPAGPPIYSTPAEWTEKGLFPRSLVNVAVNSHELGTHMVDRSYDTKNYDWMKCGTDTDEFGKTSHNISNHLLKTYNDHGARRFGSYVFDDQVPYDITVDWPLIKPYVPFIFQLAAQNGMSDTIGELLEQVDLTLLLGDADSTGLIPDTDLLALALLLSGSDIGLDIDPDDVDNLEAAVANSTVATDLIKTALNVSVDSFFNLFNFSSGSPVFSADDDSVLDQLNSTTLAGLLANNLNATDTSLELEYGKVVIADDGEELRFVNVELVLNNDTRLMIGNLTVTSDQVAALLPDDTEDYKGTLANDYTILHNASSWHGLFFFHGHLREAAYQKYCSPSDVYDENGAKSWRYRAVNYPLPLTSQQALEIRTVLSIFASLFLLIPLCYAPASFVTFVVKERATKSKHLQVVSGASLTAYWISTYIFDVVLFALLTGMIMLVFLMYGKDSAMVFLFPDEAALATTLLVFLFGVSTLPLNYVYSFLFSNHSTAQITIMGFNFVTGFCCVIGYFIMSNIPDTKELASQLVHVFRMFPPYNLGEGFINLASVFFENTILGGDEPIFGWECVGRNLTFMCYEAASYFVLTLMLESTLLRKLKAVTDRLRVKNIRDTQSNTEEEDDDVAEEAERVARLREQRSRGGVNSTGSGPDRHGPTIMLDNLIKTYPAPWSLGFEIASIPGTKPLFEGLAMLASCVYRIVYRILCCGASPRGGSGGGGSSHGVAKRAVRGLSLAVPRNECFGFLGINGAGKTTTLSILTGDLDRTSGVAQIAGTDVNDPASMQLMGYCPQVDPLLELMTGRETLRLFGRLKGIPTGELDAIVSDILFRVGLTVFADKVSGSYSGGNKRKLSFAVALIAEPPVILLDEPSTGMDPVARRQMWDAIASAARNRSVVLTTHSMEECEALCSRVGIMVMGKFRCLGSVQHLKAKFCSDYKIEVRCSANSGAGRRLSSDLGGVGGVGGGGGGGVGGGGDPVTDVVKFMQQTFPGAAVEERHGTFVRFDVPTTAMSLSDAFASIEAAKERLSVMDYAISQGSLEQVFMRFAKRQFDWDPANQDNVERPPDYTEASSGAAAGEQWDEDQSGEEALARKEGALEESL